MNNLPNRWFTKEWYQYLFAERAYRTSLWTAFWCRLKGHPDGPIYYNPSGLEPDDRCINCGDHI